MLDIDKWQEILETIGKNKLRTALTAFSVSWGIFMLVMLLGFGNGLRNGVEHTFNDDAINSLWISSGQTSMPHKGLLPGRKITFTNNDHELIKNSVEDVEYITSRFSIRGTTVVTYKDEYATFDIRCTHPDHRYVENTIITYGRFLNDNDLKEYRKVAVLGTLVVDQLFQDEDPMGKYIKINGVSFRVIGVFEDEGGEWEQRKIYIPISTAQRTFNGKDQVNRIIFTTQNQDADKSLATEGLVRQMLAEKHRFAIDDERAVHIRNNMERFRQVTGLFLYIEIFVWFVGILTIIAGIVGVANIMTISVKERTREIGIRKAIGATPFSIVSLIMQEAVLITFFSGYFGLIAGVGLLELLDYGVKEFNIELGFFRDPGVDFGTAMAATIILVIAGSLAGLIPSMKAARISPIMAIREA